MGRRLAVIIGVNEYQDPTFRSLHYAETDARALAQWLVNSQGGAWTPSDVQMVLGSHATKELVEKLIIQTCLQSAGPGDSVLIYFAGHTFLDEQTGEGYLALSNTLYNQLNTGVHVARLAEQALATSRADNTLVVFDYVQSGRLWSLRRSAPFDSKPLLGPSLLQAVQQVPDRIFLCSCRGNEFQAEANDKNLGQLVHSMILGFCGPARDTATNTVSLQQLNAYLFNVLPEQRRPQVFGSERKPMILVGELAPPITAGQAMPGFQSGFFPKPSASPPPTHKDSTATLPSSGPATATLPPANIQTDQQAAQLLKQARYLVQMQNPAQALHLLEQSLAIKPNDVAAMTLKAQIFGASNRLQEALQLVNRAMQLVPDDALLWSLQAALLTNIGQYSAALMAADRSLQLDPGNPETNSIKATIMTKLAETNNLPETVTRASGGVKQPSGNTKNPSANFQTPPTIFQQKTSQPGLRSSFLFLAVGVVAIGLMAAFTKVPAVVPVLLFVACLSVALFCVNTFRRARSGGLKNVLGDFFLAGSILFLVAIVALTGLYTKFFPFLRTHPNQVLPGLFFVLWLSLVGVLPVLAGLAGFISRQFKGNQG